MRHEITQRLRDGARALATPALWALAPRGRREISAMVRVHNEEEFLRSSILSIVDDLDEIVLVDNLSEDATPRIIAELTRAHPGKIHAYEYPHRIARVGVENIELARSPGGLDSPSLLANYYNWCLARCTRNWALKWDADMVAVPELRTALDEFRRSTAQVLHISGANVHPDLTHHTADEDIYTEIEFYEPRLFARRFARYADFGGEHETLYSPYRVGRWAAQHDRLTYVHLKYCKTDPHRNNSDEDRRTCRAGSPLPTEYASIAAAAMSARGS